MEGYKRLIDILEDVDNLGDWHDPKEEVKYREVLYKICHLYHQFDKKDSHNVFFAIRDICSKKFPDDQVYDKDGYLKQGLPVIDNYLGLFIWNEWGLDLIVKQTNFESETKRMFPNKQLKPLTAEEKCSLRKQADLYVAQIEIENYTKDNKVSGYC